MASTMIDEELDARLGPRTSHPCGPCEGKEGAMADGTEPIWVEWDGPDDPQNPLNWSKGRKWLVTTLGLMYTSIVSVAVTSYSISEGSVARELNVKPILATLGVTCFTIAFGTVPLILAPLSELFGRRLIYFASGFGEWRGAAGRCGGGAATDRLSGLCAQASLCSICPSRWHPTLVPSWRPGSWSERSGRVRSRSWEAASVRPRPCLAQFATAAPS